MFEVPITQKWFEADGSASFLEWIELNNIAADDWNFRSTANLFYPTFLFRHEEDVIAFRLRFSL